MVALVVILKASFGAKSQHRDCLSHPVTNEWGRGPLSPVCVQKSTFSVVPVPGESGRRSVSTLRVAKNRGEKGFSSLGFPGNSHPEFRIPWNTPVRIATFAVQSWGDQFFWVIADQNDPKN